MIPVVNAIQRDEFATALLGPVQEWIADNVPPDELYGWSYMARWLDDYFLNANVKQGWLGLKDVAEWCLAHNYRLVEAER